MSASTNGASRRYPTPVEQMLAELTAAKRAGVKAEAAWEAALEAIKWPWDQESAETWRGALEDSREEWLASYEGRSTVCAERLARLDRGAMITAAA